MNGYQNPNWSRPIPDTTISAEIRAAELWLDSTKTQPHTIRELAAYLGYSESHIRRHFLRAFGMGPGRYRNILRLEQAARLLLRSRRRIIDIAIHCGFRSHPIFSRAFQWHYGISPSQFRRRQLRHAKNLRPPPDEMGEVVLGRHPEITLWAIRHYGPPEPASLSCLDRRHHGDRGFEHQDTILVLADDPAITPRARQRVDLGLPVSASRPWPPPPCYRRLTLPETLAASIAFDDSSRLTPLHDYLLDRWLPSQPVSYLGEPVRVIRRASGSPRYTMVLPLTTQPC
ncbi:helix-turn-helix transcriptional regulator [Halomonas pacifica]|uniref:helix-turn-helix transcriptional regulator n=1 Tax=Bisbaumannia pacifica TaxID=77098 RepID=UPI002359199C|nr:helix-turn-helix transcriptional regulator [Halomonas pacifica]MDC8805433.1 helix-turn-helix transcriptional regulator [Halomonas pacifica]